MKPLALTLQGFGPYAEAQTIDFTALGERRLFLIHGPTGAGKTSVLDGMCFALYGDATGGERDGRGMRSDFVGADVETRVTLDFAVGDKTYRVTRQPAYERPKLRGEGTTTTPARAELWDRSRLDGSDDAREGELVASNVSQVTKAVESVLGFRSEQFRQVIVLPQGRFRDLLLASSQEREEILQQLFDTAFYARIQDELKARRKSLGAEAATLRTRRQTLLEHEGCDSADALDEALKVVESEKAEAEQSVALARQRAEDAAKALERAEALAAKFAKLHHAEQALADLAARTAEVDGQRAVVEAARRAAGLADLAVALARRRDEAGTATRREKTLAGELAQAQQARKDAVDRLAEEKGRDAARERARESVAELGRVGPVMARLQRVVAEHKHRQTEYETTRRQWESDCRRQEKLEESIRSLEASVRTAEAGLEDRQLLERRLADATAALASRDELAAAEAEERTLVEQVASARQQAERADADLNAARDTLKQRLDAREASRAAALAAELEPGKPCPVCGSEDHPQPARVDGQVPAAADIEAAETAVAESESGSASAHGALERAQAGLSAAVSRVAAAKARLGDLAARAPDALRADRQAAEEQLARHDAAAGELVARREALDARQAQSRELSSANDQARARVESLRAGLSGLQATVESTREQVPGRWREVADVARAEAEAVRELEVLENALEAASRNEADTRLAVARLESAHAAAEADARRAGEALEETRAEWARRLAEAGFVSDGDYEEARRPAAEADGLQAAIERYDRDRLAAETAAGAARAEVDGLQPPDLESLATAAAAAAREHARAAETHGAIGQRIETLAKTREALGSLEQALNTAEERYGVVGAIADAANGQNPHRISLQRFVLASRLDDVLAAASKRLAMMSRGRYLLRRNVVANDRRSAGGLELEVEDAYTARSRPVATLSGGESFQAALSLALGLSEVVQAYAGGIRLDTMFVDEGFGSLDPEALDLAINTLIDLQASGRLVGVISHVPELKERIDVRLEIQPGTTGSRARFRLP